MGSVDVLMNNAGVAVRGAFEQIPMADWEWIVGINLLGVVRGCRAFAPHMIERGSGWIVNTASIGGLVASTIGSPYVTTKHGVVGFSESLSLYLRPKGIGVSVLCPGGVATNIGENMRRAGTDASMWGRAPGEGAGAGLAQAPAEVAEILLEAIGDGKFVVPTMPLRGAIAKRAEAIETLATPRDQPGR
jgi:NAD(P)-dependent dehydrogenase (short-subunit alcohol dehydrogenase family)